MAIPTQPTRLQKPYGNLVGEIVIPRNVMQESEVVVYESHTIDGSKIIRVVSYSPTEKVNHVEDTEEGR